jgi:hypothetical protein
MLTTTLASVESQIERKEGRVRRERREGHRPKSSERRQWRLSCFKALESMVSGTSSLINVPGARKVSFPEGGAGGTKR